MLAQAVFKSGPKNVAGVCSTFKANLTYLVRLNINQLLTES